ncbi:MAG: alkaline phosphatase [Clostridia bacterium]|nr:alkaline phosphatase [Clostridia bacterium]
MKSKKILSLILAILMCLTVMPNAVFAENEIQVYLTVSVKGVIASDNDGTPMANREVTVKDIDGDGTLTYDEALIAAHKAYNAENGYATADSYGYTSVTKLWGTDTYNTLFFVNNTGISGVSSQTVENGDKLVASINKDDLYYADWYTFFDVPQKNVKVNEEFSLTLSGHLGMAYTEEDLQDAVLSGISIGLWNDSSFSAIDGKVTDESGEVSLSFDKAGTYYVTADGTVEDEVTVDWSTYAKDIKPCPIIAPVCVVTVSEDAIGGETGNGIKNIIYLIPDGGGYPLYDFANLVKIAGGFNTEKFPYKTPTDTEPMSMRSQLAGSMITKSASSAITDSAAAGTAMATGYKTVNGYVGVDKSFTPKANLVEAAESVGKATGIISTYHWSHATPATFTAHAIDRGDDLNIYQQVENKDLEVVLGVGYGMVSQYATIQNAIDNGYTVVETKEDLLNVKPGEKIWGNIVDKTYPYDVELKEGQATLAEMTAGAIKALTGDPDGFFLMVEGGKVDTGGHSNDVRTTTSEYLAFDAAFKVALDFAKGRTDTVVICAPDHNTGGLHIPEDPTNAVADVREGIKPTDLVWDSFSHTSDNVGVYAYVPEGVSLVKGLNPVLGDTQSTREDYVIDNTALAPWCADLMGVNLDALSEELFVKVTKIGKYNTITRKFTFNNGDKYVYANQDEYYKDGVRIPTTGRTAMYINKEFYVPAEMVEEEDWNHVTEVDMGDGITGKGTATDPYILDSPYDFMEFTANIIAGNSYKGKYVRQTEDIDLSTFSEYNGIGKDVTFAGVYDGYGKKITVSVNSENDVSVFPKVSGTLMNVGTQGTIISSKSGGYASGVACYVATGGKVINCYSNANVKASYAGGITTYNYGAVGNCSFCGKLSSGKVSLPIGMGKEDKYQFWECYYVRGVIPTEKEAGVEGTAVPVAQAKTQLAAKLDSNRAGAASGLGLNVSYVLYWTNENGYPELYIPIPVITSVTVTPTSATVDKGDGILLTAEVKGQYNPSLEVVWSIEGEVSEGTTVSSDGFLVIDKNETAKTFDVMAKSHQDGSMADVATITVGENTISEPDGTRARPYLIESAEDFKALSDAMIGGEDYTGIYFRQTKDIDLSGLEDYTGVGSSETFAGFYDAAGHTINIDITSDTDQCLFPYVTGTIINLGVTGSVKNTGTAGGICLEVQEGGKIVNCWSSAYVEGDNPGGIASTNYGSIASCFFCGRLNATSGKASDIAVKTENSVDRNNYYIGTEYVQSSHNSEVTTAQLKDEVTSGLNIGISTMSKATGLPASSLLKWYYVDGTLSFNQGSTQESRMEVDPDSLTVSLYGDTSMGTIYAVMYNANKKIIEVKQYSAAETVDVEFADDTNGSYVKIMWWQTNMRPICPAKTIPLK